jgi:hypothetical protein
MNSNPNLDHHVLRLFSIPRIPNDLNEDQKIQARIMAKEKIV